MKKRRTNKDGFSLLEIMVAALVVSVLVIGQSAAFAYGSSIIQRSQRQRIAVGIATSIMEENIYNTGIAQLKETAAENGDELNFSETISISGINYVASTRVKNLLDNGNTIVRIRVSVNTQHIDPLTLCYQGLSN